MLTTPTPAGMGAEQPPASCGVTRGVQEALTRGPSPGRRDRAEALTKPTRALRPSRA